MIKYIYMYVYVCVHSIYMCVYVHIVITYTSMYIYMCVVWQGSKTRLYISVWLACEYAAINKYVHDEVI